MIQNLTAARQFEVPVERTSYSVKLVWSVLFVLALLIVWFASLRAQDKRVTTHKRHERFYSKTVHKFPVEAKRLQLTKIN